MAPPSDEPRTGFPQDATEAKDRRQAQADERNAAGKARPESSEHEAGGSGLSG